MTRPRQPRRVVAMGGGTGLPVVLRGLRATLESCGRDRLTAVVTMTDDGGSSGRLRRSLGVPPPGDLRNCLVALSEREDLLSGLFQHRYGAQTDLNGHNLGNLILAALAEQTGSFVKAVEVSSQVLRTCGRILPATFDDVVLKATLADGSTVLGETAIDAQDQPVTRIELHPGHVSATPGVIEAIERADLVVIGPGSLYTSVIPNLVVPGVAEALRRSPARVVMVGNLVTEPGTREMSLADHLEIVHANAGGRLVDALIVHEGPADPDVLERYAEEGARLLEWTGEEPDGVRLHRAPLIARDYKLRHDPRKTAEGILDAWARLDAEAPGARTRGVEHHVG